MNDQKVFFDGAFSFVAEAVANLKECLGEWPAHWDIDHICYRVATEESYATQKNILKKWGVLLNESIVNGRPIAVFKLIQPLIFENLKIDLIELPAPKKENGFHAPPQNSYREGFEHIEVVCDATFAELKEKFRKAVASNKCQVVDKGVAKDFNSEWAIKFDFGSVKFHHQSLESVVNLEKNETVYAAITKLGILRKLKLFMPLVAGTFPLNIAMPESDVDVLIGGRPLHEIEAALAEFDRHDCLNFKMARGIQNNQEYLVCNFMFSEVPFEIFAQETSSVHQRGWRHFQIEERLLKYRGESFRQKILELRGEGHKTEPAFAKALGLKGDDPYAEMANWQVLYSRA